MKQLKNNHNKLVGFVLLSLAVLCSAASCKKCDDPCNTACENFDPCCGQDPANARFKIYEILQANPSIQYNGFGPEDVATDTLVFINTARFYADYEADYYEWRIDGDNRVWNTREFFLRFSNLPFYVPAEITLKVFKNFDKNCFPNALDTAVFKRTLYTVPRDSSKLYGHYNGHLFSKPNVSNYFSINVGKNMFGDLIDTISGIFPNCNAYQFVDVYNGYRSFYLTTQGSTSGCCYGISAFGVISKQDDLRMTFGHFTFNPKDSCLWNPLDDDYLIDVFNGRKQK